ISLTHTGEMDHTKSSIRRAVRARRAAVPAATRASLDRRLRKTLGTVITAGTVVCAYVPDDDEAGGRALPSALAASGARVLLPVTPPSGPRGWEEDVDAGDGQRAGTAAGDAVFRTALVGGVRRRRRPSPRPVRDPRPLAPGRWPGTDRRGGPRAGARRRGGQGGQPPRPGRRLLRQDARLGP